MNVKTAGKVLGVDPESATEGEVKAAFARLAKQDHPDCGGTGTKLRRLKQARDRLVTYANTHKDVVDCDLCEGTGKQKMRRGGLIKCSRCGGVGKYRPKSFRRG